MSNINMESVPYGIWSDEHCTWVQLRDFKFWPGTQIEPAYGWAALCWSKDAAQANRIAVAHACGLDPAKCSVLAIREADRPECHTYR